MVSRETIDLNQAASKLGELQLQERDKIVLNEIASELGRLDVQDKTQKLQLRRLLAYSMLGTFIVLNLVTVGLCIASYPLSDMVLMSLIAATVAETATMMLIVVKYHFAEEL